MKIIETGFEGLVMFEPEIFTDARGSFEETFNRRDYENALGQELNFVQDNLSVSKKDVLRGLHFQIPPHAQAKLIQVTRGAAFDVVVDLRLKSHTYGKYFTIDLTDENKKKLFIPKGFAHGFLALSEDTIFQYKCDNYYNRDSEQSIIWNDPSLNIPWPCESPIISEKDSNSPAFEYFESMF